MRIKMIEKNKVIIDESEQRDEDFVLVDATDVSTL